MSGCPIAAVDVDGHIATLTANPRLSNREGRSPLLRGKYSRFVGFTGRMASRPQDPRLSYWLLEGAVLASER
jgi:hypothetical protein